MTRLRFDITVPTPHDQAFAFVADFSNLPEWDPGGVSSVQTEGDGPELGAVYELQFSFAGREMPLTYRITDIDAPNRVVIEGDGASVSARDEIRFDEADGGTRIRYVADLTLKGPLRLVQPFFAPLFKRLEAASREGMRSALGG
jgi:carbon monoxide dehydrogenase subunit G